MAGCAHKSIGTRHGREVTAPAFPTAAYGRGLVWGGEGGRSISYEPRRGKEEGKDKHACIHAWTRHPQVTRDILKVGDIWATDLSPLELQNAETKRVAETGGSRRIEFAESSKTLVGLRGAQQGPMKLVERKSYNTSMSVSTMNNLLVTQRLRRGDGPIVYPKSRRAERLFGAQGRTKRLSSNIKLEKLDATYVPRDDTCVKAFVRHMALAATQLSDAAIAEE